MRLRNIDLFKGVLILLVMAGHILQGSLETSLPRTIIYSFHMPLFVGISGFLFNLQKAGGMNFMDLLNRYRFRVIIPWAVAVIGYFILLGLLRPGFPGIRELIMAFVYPWYHLWFIPSFMGWVMLTWIFRKARMSDNLMLVTAMLISIGAALLNQSPDLYRGHGIISNAIGVLLHTFRPYFLFFFVFGLQFRKKVTGRLRVAEYLLPLAFFGVVIYLFYIPHPALSVLNFFMLNIFLINLVLKATSKELLPASGLLEWIGRNSLAIYLWHVVPVLLIRELTGTGNLLFFYIAAVILECIFLILYSFLLRIGFLKKFIFGIGKF